MNKELDDMQKLINHLRNKPQELSENISGWKRTFKSDACLAADMIEYLNAQLAAERAKVAGLLETIESQKQTHDALIKKVEDLQSQLEAAQVTKEATEDLQTVHMIGFHSRDDEVRGLKAQIALMREELVYVVKCDETDEHIDYSRIYNVLSLSPSDAAEMARRKDEPDWFFCDIDPDESGTSAYEAMYQHRPRLEPTLVHSSFIGPDFWCVMCPKETADEDGEEVCMSFATEKEAMAFCQKIRVEIEAARAAGVIWEK